MKKYLKYSVLPLIVTLIVLFFSTKTEASKTEELVDIVPKTIAIETKKPLLIEHYSIEKTQKVSHKLDSLLQRINKRHDFHGSVLVAKNGKLLDLVKVVFKKDWIKRKNTPIKKLSEESQM